MSELTQIMPGGWLSENQMLIGALWSSPTFMPSLGRLLAVGMAVGLVAVLPILRMVRRRRLRTLGSLHGARAGAALAADLVLVMFPFMVLMLVMLQTLWLMRETVIVHYAAYNAARSARVHLCQMPPESFLLTYVELRREAGCTNDRWRAENAARISLISASPPWGIPCQQQCQVPETVLRAIAERTGTGPQADAIIDQAHYAFDPENVYLSVEMERSGLLSAMTAGKPQPVRARLTFRHYVVYGFGPIFGKKRQDGYYYRETTAEMVLL